MANTTEKAKGTKRNFDGPTKRATGRKTTQIARVETNEGMAISWEPSTMDCRKRLAQFDMAVDVFQSDGRIVDEDPDRKGQTSERHQIQGIAHEDNDDDCSQYGKRDRNENDHRASPAPEETAA